MWKFGRTKASPAQRPLRVELTLERDLREIFGHALFDPLEPAKPRLKRRTRAADFYLEAASDVTEVA